MEDKNAEATTELKPGETIHPSQVPTAVPPAEPAVVAPISAAEATTGLKPAESIQLGQVPTAVPPAEPELATLAPADEATAEPITPSLSEEEPPVLPPAQEAADPVSNEIAWTASEYIDHAKSPSWYLALAGVAVLAAILLYVFFRDIITAVTPLVAALAFGFYGRRKPRQLQYHVDSQGLTIETKFLPYSSFRSFAVIEEGAFDSIAFLPLKRFGILTTVYLDPKDEDAIIDLLNQYLPFEPRENDAVDRLMKRIRF